MAPNWFSLRPGQRVTLVWLHVPRFGFSMFVPRNSWLYIIYKRATGNEVGEEETQGEITGNIFGGGHVEIEGDVKVTGHYGEEP